MAAAAASAAAPMAAEESPMAVGSLGEELGEFDFYAPSALAACTDSERCPRLDREAINALVFGGDFGRKLCRGSCPRAFLFDRVATIAREHRDQKQGSLTSKVWTAAQPRKGQWQGSAGWLQTPVDVRPLTERALFKCTSDVYDYRNTKPNTLVVDFANRHVGGGCFNTGFVQEEQMVAQSTDFAARLHNHRQVLEPNQAICYEGVYMDAWWPFREAAKKEKLNVKAIQSCLTGPFNILAVDAPKLGSYGSYTAPPLQMLACKIFLVFHVATQMKCPLVFSGLLGGGAFRNNRPLVLLLHLLLHTEGAGELLFHHPIFWSFAGVDTDTLQDSIPEQAEVMMARLREVGVSTLQDCLWEILQWDLPNSYLDADLAGIPSKDAFGGAAAARSQGKRTDRTRLKGADRRSGRGGERAQARRGAAFDDGFSDGDGAGMQEASGANTAGEARETAAVSPEPRVAPEPAARGAACGTAEGAPPAGAGARGRRWGSARTSDEGAAQGYPGGKGSADRRSVPPWQR